MAPLPGQARGHFALQLRRFVLTPHHQGDAAVERLLTTLHAIGISISKREATRSLIAGQDTFPGENREVLPAGRTSSLWICLHP
ncbi:MAG: hypothetical protein ACREFP_15445 [Acetobacteraceae bacterium]